MKTLIRIASAFLLLGAVLWNGWVFGYLNHGPAGYIHMSISELEARRQLHAQLFNILEDVSGIFMIVGGVMLLAVQRGITVIFATIIVCIIAIGGLTLYDVAHPLDCNQYHNPACQARVKTGEVSRTDVLHNEESRITAYVTILLALLVILWVWQQGAPRTEIVWVSLCALAVIVPLAFLQWGNNVTVNAIAERIWNVAASIDIGIIAWRGLKTHKTHAVSSNGRSA